MQYHIMKCVFLYILFYKAYTMAQMNTTVYLCADGLRTLKPEDCQPDVSRLTKISECMDTIKNFTATQTICPGGFCVSHDSECMRPCGTNFTYDTTRYAFDKPCVEWPGQCVRSRPLPAATCPEKIYCPRGGEFTACYTHRMCVKDQSYCKRCYTDRCASGKCMKIGWKCNSEFDCEDRSDEQGCVCYNGRCGDGLCIKSSWQCDGLRQCMDGADEYGCDAQNGGGSGTGMSMSFIIGGVVLGVLVLVVVLACKYRYRFTAHRTHNQSTNRAVVVSGTTIPMQNQRPSNTSNPYTQPAPAYNSVVVSGAPPYPVQGFGTPPYAKQTDYGSPPSYESAVGQGSGGGTVGSGPG